ncbi:MAG: redox-sensitive transcriptional activator SoxR [Thiolinea sp.]
MAYRGNEVLSIGLISERTGVTVSALRFYEEKGLLQPQRNQSGHRRYRRADIRRVSFVRVAQKLGFTLPEIQQQLDTLPNSRTPTKADWAKLARQFRVEIDARISALEQLRDTLDGCIGCGCLSLQKCELYNRNDEAAALGSGPRYLLGDEAKT